MKFTHDWFSPNINTYQKHRALLGNKSNILEIGSFEGRSAIWFYENLLVDGGTITCVDKLFYPGAKDQDVAPKRVEKTLRYNLSSLRSEDKTVRLFIEDSHTALCRFTLEKEVFDFIYVDGSHSEPDKLRDMVLSFYCLSLGGVMVIDDYAHPNVRLPVDSFYKIFDKHLKLVERGYQVIFQKIRSDTFVSYDDVHVDNSVN